MTYTVTAGPGGATCTVTSPATSCVVTGLTNGTSYTFTSTATNSIGTSSASAASSAVVPGPPGVPATPTGVVGDTQVTVSVTAGSGGTPVTYTVTTVEDNTKTCTVTAPATSCVVTGLTNGTPYTFTATATNGSGSSAASSASSAVTPAPASSGGGGGGGGGGSASSSSSTNSTVTAQSSVGTSTTTASASQTQLDPIPPANNPNLPAGGVPAGGSVLLVGGEPRTVVVAPDAPRSPTGLVASGGGVDEGGEPWSVKLVGRGDLDDPLGLTEKSALILQSSQVTRKRMSPSKRAVVVTPVAEASGQGFMTTSPVKFYILPTTYMGELATDSAGVFSGTVPVPRGITPGTYTLQMNGFAADGQVRSLSIGVIVKPAVGAALKAAKTAVFFDVMSPVVTPAGKAALRALVKRTGKSGFKNVMVGFVQASSVTSNDLTLSLLRAKRVAAYLRSIGLKGAFTLRGAGVAKQPGALARRVNVTIEYRAR